MLEFIYEPLQHPLVQGGGGGYRSKRGNKTVTAELPSLTERIPIPSGISIRRCIFTQPALPFQPNLLPSFEQSSLPINFGGRRKLSSDDWKLEDTPRVNLFPNL